MQTAMSWATSASSWASYMRYSLTHRYISSSHFCSGNWDFAKKLPDLKLVYVWHCGRQKARPSVRLALLTMFMRTKQRQKVFCWTRRPFPHKKDVITSIPPKMTGPSSNKLIVLHVAIVKSPTPCCTIPRCTTKRVGLLKYCQVTRRKSLVVTPISLMHNQFRTSAAIIL